MGEKNLNEFLSLKEAADFCRMSPRALADRAREGLIPSYRPSKALIFSTKDLAEYIRRHKVKK
jgi:hypothetical protein